MTIYIVQSGAASVPMVAGLQAGAGSVRLQTGCGCGGSQPGAEGVQRPSFVYALGQIDARYPCLSVEKEVAQANRRADLAGLSDRQALHAVVSRRENRYLARQLCWVLTIQGLETYIVVPRDPADLDALVEALAPRKQPLVHAIVGLRGPIAPPDACNGLMLPLLAYDQMYSFDREALIRAIPRPEELSAEGFEAAAAELFDRVLQLTDNAGSTDEHRAINYLAIRYSDIYTKVAEEYAANAALDAVQVIQSRLTGNRNVIDVVLVFTDRAAGFTKKYFTRVDVTEEFPFLVTKLSPYYDRQ
jgi:hypothetical protein